MHKKFENIENTMCREMEMLNQKYSNGSEMSENDLKRIDLLAHAMKSLATYSAMKESEGWGETSERHSYSRDDGYSGRSYADGYTQGYRDAQHSGHYPMMPEYAYHNGRNW